MTRLHWGGLASLMGLLAACGGSGGPGDSQSMNQTAQAISTARLSGPSPFAGNCGLQGKFDSDREGCAHIAADPAHPDRIVVAWSQHRQVNGGWLGGVTAATGDGGRTWIRATLPASTSCTNGEFPHMADPWAGFGADGRAFVSSIATTIHPVSASTLPSAAYAPEPGAVRVHTSEVGGVSWRSPFGIDPEDAGTLEDRDTLAAHPSDSRRVYVAWGKFIGAIPGPTDIYFARLDLGPSP